MAHGTAPAHRYLLDAYNVAWTLHARRGGAARRDPEAVRGALFDLLHRWQAHTGMPVTLVLDGRLAHGGEYRRRYPRLAFIFSGAEEAADPVLLRLVERDPQPAHLMVVSSDRAVRAGARRRRARVQSSDEFLANLDAVLGRADGVAAEPRAKREGLAPGEVAAWLRVFADAPKAGDSPPRRRRVRGAP